MKEKGITLIALIVTIIVLIILAGITIATLTREDGIINNAKNAKEETEIANEKEIVDRATINAMGNNKRGNIVKDELQDELDRITKVGNTEVEDSGEEFEVVFVNTNRYYIVDIDGDIIEEGKIVIDKSPGDITKDENGNDIEEGQPYEIWCIEDLVAFSNMVNGSGIIIENGKAIEVNTSTNFSNKTVELKTNLNFKSKYSYANSERTDFGDINENENDGNTLMNEMTTGTGFKPIGESLGKSFAGVFNGNDYEVQQIYINQTTNSVGLFGNINDGIIQSLGISGNITGNDAVGGIAGMSGNNTLIQDCYNKANIDSNGNAGGIVGVLHNGGTTIINCYNDVQSAIKGNNAGGIIGISGTVSAIPYIYNSYNLGNINGSIAGGIIGYVYDHAECINVYSTGNITGNTVGGIVGSALWNNTSQNKFENCYFLKSDTVQKSAGSKITVNASMLDNLTDTTINELNSYISNNGSLTYEWKKWTLGSDGYPVFV